MKNVAAAVFALGVLSTVAMAADGWVDKPAQDFRAGSVDFGPVCGVVKVDVAGQGKVRVQISGMPDRLKPIQVRLQDGRLKISGESCLHGWQNGQHLSGWDLLDYIFGKPGGKYDDGTNLKKLQVHVTVPEGTPLSASDVAGNFHIGNTHGALKFSGHSSGDVFAGDVASADLYGSGSGDFVLGHVAGQLKAVLHGSGDLTAAAAGTLNVQTHGSGDISVAHVSGAADCATHGSGDLNLKSVAGPLKANSYGSGDIKVDTVSKTVDVRTSGSGDIRIRHGNVDSITAHSSGSGDITYGGTAKHVDSGASGFGDVNISR